MVIYCAVLIIIVLCTKFAIWLTEPKYSQSYSISVESVEPVDNEPIYQQIDFYKSRLDMLEDLQNLISDDLRNMTKRDSRYQAKLNKLISLDNQIHTTQNKIDKLEKLLE